MHADASTTQAWSSQRQEKYADQSSTTQVLRDHGGTQFILRQLIKHAWQEMPDSKRQEKYATNLNSQGRGNILKAGEILVFIRQEKYFRRLVKFLLHPARVTFTDASGPLPPVGALIVGQSVVHCPEQLTAIASCGWGRFDRGCGCGFLLLFDPCSFPISFATITRLARFKLQVCVPKIAHHIAGGGEHGFGQRVQQDEVHSLVCDD